jgi:hypothetical protein
MAEERALTDWMRLPEDTELHLPPDIDLSKPSIARVYDYGLGGKDNFAVDRAVAEEVWEQFPEMRSMAVECRVSLRRMVRYLVGEAGIRQIIDIGSGLPTVGNVHETAHEIDPSTRVVYVDNDPIVLAHGQALLADNDTTVVIMGDLLEQETIFDSPITRSYIDESQPYAILVASLLHHLEDDQDPAGLCHALSRRLPSGGYLLSVNFLDDGEDLRAPAMEETFRTNRLGTGRVRTFAEQLRFFEGLELVEPGLVRANEWRPDEHTPKDSPIHNLLAAGLGRKN